MTNKFHWNEQAKLKHTFYMCYLNVYSLDLLFSQSLQVLTHRNVRLGYDVNW